MTINEKILDMRNGILKVLKEEQPGLEKLISDNNYFVSRVAVTLQEGNIENYTLIDFTYLLLVCYCRMFTVRNHI